MSPHIRTSRWPSRQPWSRQGVTLVEIALALGLLALSLGGIYAFMNTGSRSARVTNNFLQTQVQVRAGLDAMVEEMRWAQSVLAASATTVTLFVPQNTPFSATSPYAVTFAYDAVNQMVTRQEDPDAAGPAVPLNPEPIAYSVVREDGSAGLSFEYFDAAGSSLGSTPADLSAVVRVRATVATTRNGIMRVFASDAALRGR